MKMLDKIFGSLSNKSKTHFPGKTGVELYSYKKPDGSFDYEKYRQIQIAGNKEKIGNVWVLEDNISFLSDYISKKIPTVEFGLCHGTRNGKEQEWFRKYLHANVLGTEISDTAEQFPNTIQWDFHDIKDEWINNADFIYSNSFDHSYDQKKCLDNWMSCIKKGGVCILEHSSGHTRASKLDPFGADIALMPYLILLWGEGKYAVTEILSAPSKGDTLKYLQYLVIRNNN